jgi:hypothetical protein
MIREMLQSQNVIIEYLLSARFNAIIPFLFISVYDRLYYIWYKIALLFSIKNIYVMQMQK